jgi:chlorobactene glucosyltransferase
LLRSYRSGFIESFVDYLPLIASVFVLASATGLVFWIAVKARVGRTVRARPTVRRGLDAPLPSGETPTVSVVVPVHNEQRVIDQCARSLRNQQYETLEIIFVLDRCTDDSAEMLQRHAAEDARVKLIHNDSCPEDWAGKCHAARLGAEGATGEYLLFTDADTSFDRELIRAAVTLARRDDIALLSLLSTLTFRHAWERSAQPVATMALIRLYPIERVNRRDPSTARPFANGQFMLFRRDDYERIGGHAAVKDDLLEDIAFARRLNDAGGRCGVYLADGMLLCSMYESLGAFRTGWKRIFIEACKRKPRRLRKNALRLVLNGIVLPANQVAAIIAGGFLLADGWMPLGSGAILLALAGALVQGTTLRQIYTLGGAPARSAWRYPLGAWIVARILLAAAWDLEHRRPIPWAGREYVLEPRY